MAQSLQEAWAVINRLKADLEQKNINADDPVTVIGMACRFPGDSNTPEGYWSLIESGKDGIREIPRDRWNVEDLYDQNPWMPGKIYTERAGFIDGVDRFDADFFKLSPVEARSMDPQHRLLLETSWEALESAGLCPNQLKGSRAGVFIGMSQMDYAQHLIGQGGLCSLNEYSNTGNGFSFSSGRISYFYGFHGPSMVVDTACSSSLTAVHLAVESLRRNECEFALAGGAQLLLSPETFVGLSRMQVLAADGACKPFDDRADGYGRGEGCGFVVLMRESEVRRRELVSLAKIHGTAVNHGGSSAGFTVPNGAAQRMLILSVLKESRISPDLVSYVETHGTGTRLGDPIELEALADCYRPPAGKAGPPLCVGSVKSNIGHLEAAAGIASLIKVVLMLSHNVLPPQSNLRTLNSNIAWEQLPISISRSRTDFPSVQGRQLAAVTSFGIGGSNGHLILESCQAERNQATAGREYILALSANTPLALRQMVGSYLEALRKNENPDLQGLCLHTNTVRGSMAERVGLVGSGRSELIASLETFQSGQESPWVVSGRVERKDRPRMAFLFTGQGSYYPAMGMDLYRSEPDFKEIMDRCQQRACVRFGGGFLEHLFGHAGETKVLSEVEINQASIYALQCGLVELWRAWGIEPHAVLGHSIGEYAAAWTSGVFSLEDGLEMVIKRASLIHLSAPPGAMLSVFAPANEVRDILAEAKSRVSIAAINGPASLVLSGDPLGMVDAKRCLQKQRILTQQLAVPFPYHSELIEPILPEFKSYIAGKELRDPRIPHISCIDGNEVKKEIRNPQFWCDQTRGTVQFYKGMQTLEKLDVSTFVEIGPTPMLISMGQGCLPDKHMAWLPSMRPQVPARKQMAATVSALFTRGMEVDWRRWYRGTSRPSLTPLPPYPFERKRHWMEQTRKVEAGAASGPLAPRWTPADIMGVQLPGNAHKEGESTWVRIITENDADELASHEFNGRRVLSFAVVIEWLMSAGRTALKRPGFLSRIELTHPIEAAQKTRLVATRVAADDGSGMTVSIVSQSLHEGSGQWVEHCSARFHEQHSLEIKPIRELMQRMEMASGRDLCWEARESLSSKFLSHCEQMLYTEMEAVGIISLKEQTEGYAILDLFAEILVHALPLHLREPVLKRGVVPIEIDRFEQVDSLIGRMSCHAQILDIIENDKIFGLRADISLSDLHGNLRLNIKGITLTSPVSSTPPAQRLDGLIYGIDWRTEPIGLTAPRSNDIAWCVVGRGDEEQNNLCSKLKARGDLCYSVVWRPQAIPSDFLAKKENEFGLAFKAILDQSGTSTIKLIFLAPRESHQNFDECIILFSCCKALARLQLSRAVGLWIYTQGAQAIELASPKVNCHQGALWGFAKGLFREFSDWKGGLYDLEPSDGTEAHINIILLTLQLENKSGALIRGGQLKLPEMKRRDGIENPTGRWTVKSDCTYLITGGTGGIGRSLLEHLCTNGAKHVVLVARKEFGTETKKAILKWRSVGAHIEFVNGDAGSNQTWERVLELQIIKQHPPIAVFHLAGKLDDALLVNYEESRLEDMLAGKATGAWLLHQISQNWKLDAFVLFSSAASLVPMPGQCAYAAANAFLDSLALYRRSLGLPAQVINWGTWAEVGHVKTPHGRLAHNELRRQGIEPLTTETALDVLKYLLAGKETQTAAIRVDWNILGHLDSSLTHWPLLNRLIMDRQQELPSFTRRDHVSMTWDEVELKCRKIIEKEIQNLLELRHSLDTQTGFRELGLDSFMAQKLRRNLENKLHLSLPITLAFQFPNIVQLSSHLADLLHRGRLPENTKVDHMEKELEEAVIMQMDSNPDELSKKLTLLESLLRDSRK